MPLVPHCCLEDDGWHHSGGGRRDHADRFFKIRKHLFASGETVGHPVLTAFETADLVPPDDNAVLLNRGVVGTDSAVHEIEVLDDEIRPHISRTPSSFYGSRVSFFGSAILPSHKSYQRPGRLPGDEKHARDEFVYDQHDEAAEFIERLREVRDLDGLISTADVW